ncbi:Structure-specific endonuclease subunit slx1 [Echinococcus granulosus]|nr:Structure-specific endonuclease subunit slx1 [Echinococcus granulosus]
MRFFLSITLTFILKGLPLPASLLLIFAVDEMLDQTYEASALDGFHGCYLLVSLNPHCNGRTYVGYTVNPKRRIQQHNSGSQCGGAKSTGGKGPWVMVLVVHGFPNDISALRFPIFLQKQSARHLFNSAFGFFATCCVCGHGAG